MPLLAACSEHPPSGVRAVTVQDYFYGAFGGAAIDLRDVCGDGEAREMSVHRRATDYLLSIATLGVYLPHQIRVRCRAASIR